MMTRTIHFLFLIFFIGACQGKRSNLATEVQSDSFLIKLSIVAKKNDRIEIFYLDSKDNQITFSEEKKISKDVVGSVAVQTLSFVLPIEALPNTFRIDIGNNKEQGVVCIKKIVFKSVHGEFRITGKELKWFFTTNKFLKPKGNGQYEAVEIDGRLDPYMLAKAILNKKLEIEL